MAVITGAASGIGRAASFLFSAEGASMACVDINYEGVQETAETIRKRGGDAVAIHADVSRREDVERMSEQCAAHYGRVHVLFNNAGGAGRTRTEEITLEELTLEEWNRDLALNLTSHFLCSKYLLPAMKAAGGGSIIHNGSIDGVMGNPRIVAYSVAKGGLVPLTHVMAYHLAKHNIRVNCICPAGIASSPEITVGLLEPYRKLPGGQQFLDNLASATLLGRLGAPEEVASVALFLASDESSYVTGTVLMIDGGRSAITPGTGRRISRIG